MRVTLSADFLDDNGKPVFPDIGLSTVEGVEGLSHRFLDRYLPEYAPDQLEHAEVLLSLKPRVTAASLERAGSLIAIGRYGVGYDNVDLAACTERDIAVYITRDAVVRPVASSIVLLVLAASHNLVWKDRLIRRGEWAASTKVLGKEPREKVLGTVGLGNIASEALRLLRPFGFARILAHDPAVAPEKAAELGAELTDLDTVMRESDYVLVNCPLTQATRGLISAERIAMMKPTAALINTARGPIVDEVALTRALLAGSIRCAALDVFEQEPLPADSPLKGCENAILTSHSLCWTEELFRDMGRQAWAGALAVRQGRAPDHVVNPEVLARPGFRAKLAAAARR